MAYLLILFAEPPFPPVLDLNSLVPKAGICEIGPLISHCLISSAANISESQSFIATESELVFLSRVSMANRLQPFKSKPKGCSTLKEVTTSFLILSRIRKDCQILRHCLPLYWTHKNAILIFT